LLLREIDTWKMKVLALRRELEDKGGAVGRLEVLLRERLNRIDDLTAQVDQLRQRNRKLDTECERLAEIVRSEGRSSWLSEERLSAPSIPAANVGP
jgi:hypothetical protein